MSRMAARKPSSRIERRARERELRALANDRARLAALEAGGAPERPIAVPTAALVEPSARGVRCALCDAPLTLEEHAAVTVDGVRLRVVRMRCPACGARRELWYRIVTSAAS